MMLFSEPLPDYYDVLGVDRGASERDIVVAYRREVRQCHPDAHPGSAVKGERIREVNQAYEVLGDPKLRAEYDRELAWRERPTFPLDVPLTVGFGWSGREGFRRGEYAYVSYQQAAVIADFLATLDVLFSVEELALARALEFERAFLVVLTGRSRMGWPFWPW